MIKWYSDKDLSIFFSEVPRVCIRYVLPSSTPDEVKSIKKYPFINKKELKVQLLDRENCKNYNFTISKGYCYDGATIPKLFWRVIGSKTNNTFLIAALIHDWCCEHKECVGNDRNFSSKVFKALLLVGGVGKVKANVMFGAVDTFQRFCGW